MAPQRSPNRSIAPSEVTVTVTVLRPVRDGQRRKGPAGISVIHAALTAVGVGLALAALAAVITTDRQNGPTSRSAAARRAQAEDSGSAAIATAFGHRYLRRCVTVTISASDPDYARANVNRTNGCGHYHGYLNASFHRVGGRWRLVLDEGQPFVPNSLLSPCGTGRAACARTGEQAGGMGSQPRAAGSRELGAASGYPLGCLSVAIALHDPRFARTDFDRTICTRRRARRPA